MLNFVPAQPNPNRKTLVWGVVCNNSYLGDVRWYSAWRRYCYITPTSASITLDASCMKELVDFCETQTKKHAEDLAMRKINATKS